MPEAGPSGTLKKPQAKANRCELPASFEVWDVLSWIAFDELRPRPDFPDAVDFTLQWGSSSATHTLDALEARSSETPFCIWEPLALDEQPWDGRSYKHVAWSPMGPRMLRYIARQLRVKYGRTVTFREAASMLRAEAEIEKQNDELIREAKHDLMEALRSRRVTAWGKRDARNGSPNPQAEYEAIPATVFLDDMATVTEWGTLGADPDHPTALFEYRGSTFRDLRFYTDEILTLWPARHPKVAATPLPETSMPPIGTASPVEGTDESKGKHTMRIFREPFWQIDRVVRWIAFRDPMWIEGNSRATKRYSLIELQDKEPQRTLIQALQTEKLYAIRDSRRIPGVEWAAPIGHRSPAGMENVHFARADVLRLWPAQPLQRLAALPLAPQHENAQVALPSRNPRGPRPGKRNQIVARMRSDYADNFDALKGEKEESLAEKYGASRDTVRKARNAVLPK